MCGLQTLMNSTVAVHQSVQVQQQSAIGIAQFYSSPCNADLMKN